MTAVRGLERLRCECGARLFVKLSRHDGGSIRRELYCASVAGHPESSDVTAAETRRALQLQAAAREVAFGAA